MVVVVGYVFVVSACSRLNMVRYLGSGLVAMSWLQICGSGW